MRKYKASQNKVSSVWGASKAGNIDVSGLWEGEWNRHTHLCLHTSNSHQILQAVITLDYFLFTYQYKLCIFICLGSKVLKTEAGSSATLFQPIY